MDPLKFLIVCIAGWLNREQQKVIEYLKAENRVLRNKVPGKRLRFSQAERNLLSSKAKGICYSKLKELANAVTPETLTRWIRGQAGKKYDSSGTRRRGRPAKPKEIRDLVIRLAKENSGWGYTKIRGVLKSLGDEIGRTTISKILTDAGIPPAPDRRKGKKWKAFLRENMSVLSAVDFFTVELPTVLGFQRFTVMMVMQLGTRKVHLAGIREEPNGAWVEQVGRGLVDGFGGVLAGQKYLIHDRATVFTEKFSAILKGGGVRTLKLPARSPNLNSHLERWIRSIREECLDHLVLFGEGSLRYAITEYIEHFHKERPHQGLGNKIIEPRFESPNEGGEPVECRPRLGGLLKYYVPGERRAA